ncbi:Chemotaxis response - phosphatase CheZ [hydrothermal vent metagenome]|uniref:Protein phosphatase CheZ n=1 Tax=hydrothermal vent metagenome TaxID=652676 RepID=A0A3B0Y9Q8_9ZZZZ
MDDENKNEVLLLAKKLVQDLESGDASSAQNYFDQIAKMRDADLYQELGKLTRQLHESLSNFQVDEKISFLAASEIPDAKARLNHVIEMTESSANRTMNALDKAMPLSQQLEADAHKVNADWKKFRNRELSADDFRSMTKVLDDFFPKIEKSTCDINGFMTEVMMAQDFQDLTGQIITRVINLVQEVEESLVELVKISGKTMSDVEQVQSISNEKEVNGHGPEVPGVEHGNTVSGQDDVDDLLSSLGF